MRPAAPFDNIKETARSMLAGFEATPALPLAGRRSGHSVKNLPPKSVAVRDEITVLISQEPWRGLPEAQAATSPGDETAMRMWGEAHGCRLPN